MRLSASQSWRTGYGVGRLGGWGFDRRVPADGFGQTGGVSRPVHLSAATLAVTDMARAVAFYASMGFELHHGGAEAAFTSYTVGAGYLNLQAVDRVHATDWGRVIIHVTDVDAMHDRAVTAGHVPTAPPRDAPWGERYFHLRDPEGHELSFASPLPA